MKICPKCQLEQDDSEFNKNYRDGLRGLCKKCKRQDKILASRELRKVKAEEKKQASKYYKENYEKIKLQQRASWLKKNYNITIEQYDEMLKKQNNACAICLKPESRLNIKGTVQALAVDHEHVTGKIRGLLCLRCNRYLVGVGNENNIESLRKNIDLMQRAIKYIEYNITNVN